MRCPSVPSDVTWEWFESAPDASPWGVSWRVDLRQAERRDGTGSDGLSWGASPSGESTTGGSPWGARSAAWRLDASWAWMPDDTWDATWDEKQDASWGARPDASLDGMRGARSAVIEDDSPGVTKAATGALKPGAIVAARRVGRAGLRWSEGPPKKLEPRSREERARGKWVRPWRSPGQPEPESPEWHRRRRPWPKSEGSTSGGVRECGHSWS